MNHLFKTIKLALALITVCSLLNGCAVYQAFKLAKDIQDEHERIKLWHENNPR